LPQVLKCHSNKIKDASISDLIQAIGLNNTVVNGGNAVQLKELDISNNYIGNSAGRDLYLFAQASKNLIQVNIRKQNVPLDYDLITNIE